MDWPVCKLQVCKLVLIEFALPEQQNIFHIKCQKLFTFANRYLLPFQLLSQQKKCLQITPQLTYSVNILLVIQWPMRLSSEIKLPTAVKKRILFPLPTRLACHKVFENRTFGLMWHTGSCQPFSQKEDGWHNYQRPPSSYYYSN